MTQSSVQSLKIRAKLLQKAKLKKGQKIQLKDALDIVASNVGYDSWRELKVDFENSDIFNPPKWSSIWKTWFADLKEARSTLLEVDGYLLPYRKQFFICDNNYIEALGIDLGDKDLKLVGRDWTCPTDGEAFTRLKTRISSYTKTV